MTVLCDHQELSPQWHGVDIGEEYETHWRLRPPSGADVEGRLYWNRVSRMFHLCVVREGDVVECVTFLSPGEGRLRSLEWRRDFIVNGYRDLEIPPVYRSFIG